MRKYIFIRIMKKQVIIFLLLSLLNVFTHANESIPYLNGGIWIRNIKTGNIKWSPYPSQLDLAKLTIYILKTFAQNKSPNYYKICHQIYPTCLPEGWELVLKET